MIRIAIILGSTRPGRNGEAVAKWVYEIEESRFIFWEFKMMNESNDERRYDFIVVGAGAAGSVLAAELSASGAQVLVIESGGPDDAPTILEPSIWFYSVGGPLDYHLPIVPSPRLNNRKFNMALGHVF